MNRIERCINAVNQMKWLVMGMTTIEQETDKTWWHDRAYVIALDRDKPTLRYMNDRLKQRRN